MEVVSWASSKSHKAKCMLVHPNDPIASNQPCPRAHAAKSSVPSTYRSRAITQPKLATFPIVLSSNQTDVDLQIKSAPWHESIHNSLAVRTNTIPDQADFQAHDWFQAFPFQQFHVLFNSLFKVLFIFPSRYLFAIGLSPIFSFRWNLPPILSCIPKQLDSLKTYHIVA